MLLGTAVSFAISALSYALWGEQITSGLSSIATGGTAIYTGASLCAFGPIGCFAGGALIMMGGATSIFGANEIVDAVTGINYIQNWTGMNDNTYNNLYIGLNVASLIGSLAGITGMHVASNRILNNIAQNPPTIQNYSLRQIKTYGNYSYHWTPGTLKKGQHIGQGYTLSINYDGRYIQWHPGTQYHFSSLPYWKVSSGRLGAKRYFYIG